MQYAIVAVAQQSLRLYPDLDSYKRDVERFFRLAEMKHARLLVFPQRSGLMVIPPLVEGFRTGLLKKADVTRGRYRGWWERTRTQVIRGTAKLLGADVQKEMHKAVNEMPEFIWQTYVDLFAALAYEYKITVVAGSGYFMDVDDGVLREIVTVFGPDGDILGRQAKVILEAGDEEWVQPGSGWQAIDTPLGRLGILVGEEVMYPEVGRLLAYQGVNAIVTLGAARDDTRVQLLRDGLQARVTDNQVFGSLAFVVGPDPFASEDTPPYRGRSVIMAPPGMLPRRNAIIVEAGTATAEVLLTARWDFAALRAYWEQSPIPVRRRLPAKVAGPILAALYGQQVTLDEAFRALPPTAPKALAGESARAAETTEAEAGAEEETPEVPSGGEPVATTEAATQERAEVTQEGAPVEAASEMVKSPAETEVQDTALAPDSDVDEGEERVASATRGPEEHVETGAPPVRETVSEAEEVPPWEERPSAVEAHPPVGEPEHKVEPSSEAESTPTEAPQDESPLSEPVADLRALEVTTEEERESAEGKVLPEPEAPERETASPEVVDVAPVPAPSVEEPLVSEAGPREDAGKEELPPSVWEMIRAELQRAADVIKSMEWGSEATSAEEEPIASPSQGAHVSSEREESQNLQGGWFHRLAQRARQQGPEDRDTLDEF